jgi:hypothetical protein
MIHCEADKRFPMLRFPRQARRAFVGRASSGLEHDLVGDGDRAVPAIEILAQPL